ncbi:hypothetical protein Pyn_29890 [Prunus yedoensis var. nudiflora]|uniref:Uncharacterized protein n=1 Tax=Prunus yedoensis var. nudiflora TaxID=2094558 RepID=A0A314Y943_PRUYE|nr:hypothetical protein Pyn_29890 [Prunus yedoensis var. nudiflora]
MGPYPKGLVGPNCLFVATPTGPFQTEDINSIAGPSRLCTTTSIRHIRASDSIDHNCHTGSLPLADVVISPPSKRTSDMVLLDSMENPKFSKTLRTCLSDSPAMALPPLSFSSPPIKGHGCGKGIRGRGGKTRLLSWGSVDEDTLINVNVLESPVCTSFLARVETSDVSGGGGWPSTAARSP